MVLAMALTFCSCGKDEGTSADGEKFDFRSVRLGMSMDEVREAEIDSAKDTDFSVDFLIKTAALDGLSDEDKEDIEDMKAMNIGGIIKYTDVTVNSVLCNVDYTFDNDEKLTNIRAEAKLEDGVYDKLREYMIELNGKPTTDKKGLAAIWDGDIIMKSVLASEDDSTALIMIVDFSYTEE